MNYKELEIAQTKYRAMTEEFEALKSVRARRPLTPAEEARINELEGRFLQEYATGPNGSMLSQEDHVAIQRAHFEERDAFYAANGGYPKD